MPPSLVYFPGEETQMAKKPEATKRPTVLVRVWVGQEYVAVQVPGPLSVYGKQSKGSK
jgi:hypothetical protein